MPNAANKVVGAAIAAIAIAAIVAIVLMQAGGNGAPARALVHDSDGKTHELLLSRDSEVTVETSLGMNVVVVRDGAVFVREADCDNQDCVRQGSLEAPGRQIICLPHKLWIEVVAEGGSSGSMDTDAALTQDGELDVIAR